MFKITQISLIREKDSQTKDWNFKVNHDVKDLEPYRESVKEKYKATTVLLTYSEVPNASQNP